jgi:hypothetical protein
MSGAADIGSLSPRQRVASREFSQDLCGRLAIEASPAGTIEKNFKIDEAGSVIESTAFGLFQET